MTIKEHRQRLIDSLVNAVYLFDDGGIAFVFNGKEEEKTISATEIMQEMGSDLVGASACVFFRIQSCPVFERISTPNQNDYPESPSKRSNAKFAITLKILKKDLAIYL
jgi:hypothetical protein